MTVPGPGYYEVTEMILKNGIQISESVKREACRNACAADTRCQAFSWGRRRGVLTECHLYDTKDVATPAKPGGVVETK